MNNNISDKFIELIIRQYSRLDPETEIFVEVGDKNAIGINETNKRINVTALGEEEARKIEEAFHQAQIERRQKEVDGTSESNYLDVFNSMNKNKEMEVKHKEIEEAIKFFSNRSTRDGIDYLKNGKREKNRENKKRDLRNKPKTLGKGKRFLAVAAIVLSVIGGVTTWGVKNIPEYKEEAFNESLYAVKADISENTGVSVDEIKILDASTPTGAYSGKIHYVVEVGYKTYEYYEDIYDTHTTILKNTIGNDELIDAIPIVSHAKDDIFTATRAKKLAQKIEKGEVDLSIPELEKEDALEIE